MMKFAILYGAAITVNADLASDLLAALGGTDGVFGCVAEQAATLQAVAAACDGVVPLDDLGLGNDDTHDQVSSNQQPIVTQTPSELAAEMTERRQTLHRFCYAAPACKSAAKKALEAMLACAREISPELPATINPITSICPAFNVVAKATLSGTVEDYSESDKAALLQILAIAAGVENFNPVFSFVTITAGSVNVVGTLAVEDEATATEAKTNLLADPSAFANAISALPGAPTVEGNGLSVTTESTDGGLSGGAIAGIVIGSIVGVALFAGAVVCLLKKKKKPETPAFSGEPVKGAVAKGAATYDAAGSAA